MSNVIKMAAQPLQRAGLISEEKAREFGLPQQKALEATGQAEKMAVRRERATQAAASGRLRAARGRGRGYRSLLSQSRMEDQQGKGGKTTLGG